jgi:hypothetical protein
MKKLGLLLSLFLTAGIFLFCVQPVLAGPPPLPSGFYGKVKFNGSNVPAGTVVSARVNGVQYASTIVLTYLGDTVYSLDVPGDDPETVGIIEGGVEGDTVVFFIGTTQTTQIGTWQSGTNVNLNLSGSTGQITIFLPLVIH